MRLDELPAPLPDDVIEQLEAEDAEIERIWDAMERERSADPH